ncbi:hypothetical protein DES47_10750 [Roseateles toxinivorans]|uniref:Type II/III secretion system protein n=2 Tax=Roseateles toxinivorans TaxID=270368 RepID=A0A4R6QIN6_9BURK|nr:hypothetical protein DES47_10750 [Roseateles toxinivorans]
MLGRMKALFAIFALMCSAVGPVAAQPPRQNLWVELRWVDSTLSGAVMAGVRDGAVVVGTAGSVSPRGHVSVSTQTRDDASQQVQRLLVLNGQQASLRLTESTPVQWVDYGVQFDAAQPASSPGKGWAVPRQGLIEQTGGFTVTPQWPGGKQPVRVEFRALDGGSSQQQVLSTVLMPLDSWTVVARTGQGLRQQQRGVTSSRDAEGVSTRELQLRVSVAP